LKLGHIIGSSVANFAGY